LLARHPSEHRNRLWGEAIGIDKTLNIWDRASFICVSGHTLDHWDDHVGKSDQQLLIDVRRHKVTLGCEQAPVFRFRDGTSSQQFCPHSAGRQITARRSHNASETNVAL
jgi:hypothetical protein